LERLDSFGGDENMAGDKLSRQVKAKLFLAGLAIAVVFIGGSIWYFSYYTKTPDYTLKMIQESVEKHDTAKFQKYVDTDNLLSEACDALMEGLIESEKPMPEDAKLALSGFTKMFKMPLVNAFKGTINHYIETGKWGEDDSKAVDQGIPIDSDLILSKTGIKDSYIEDLEYVEVDKSAQTAVAGVRVYQKEADDSFVLEVQLKQVDNGTWRVASIRNFRDFIVFVAKARREHVQEYIATTQKLMDTHDKNIRTSEKKFKDALAAGEIGNQALRDGLKAIIQQELLPEWQIEQEELNAVEVPGSAQTLQRLRLKICDLRIAYCQKYSDWLTNKNAKTLKEANESLKEAKTLEHEASLIVTRIKNGQSGS
jgi:hypothetical protein